VLTMMGPAVPQLDVKAAAACSFPVVSAVWYGPQDPEVELVVVWKEDMVNWVGYWNQVRGKWVCGK
jgi:hypothetical protein